MARSCNRVIPAPSLSSVAKKSWQDPGRHPFAVPPPKADEKEAERIEIIKARLTRELYERTEKGEDQMDVAKDIIKKEQQRINPNAGRYEIGDTVNFTKTISGTWKVVGFDTATDGEPLFIRVK